MMVYQQPLTFIHICQYIELSIMPISDTTQMGGFSMFECPKCGHSQEQGEECVRCGVIFSRIPTPPPPPEPPLIEPEPIEPELVEPEPLLQLLEPETVTSEPLPRMTIEMQPPKCGEILILKIIAWINLIAGILAGFFILARAQHDWLVGLGIGLIFESVLTTTLIFVICIITDRVITIGHNTTELLRIQERKMEAEFK